MNNRFATLMLVCAVVVICNTAFQRPVQKGSDPCSVAEQALEDLQHVKVGMPRSELEKYFVVAGGMTFRDRTKYESRRCDYLEIEVDFKLDPAVDRSNSPNDAIANISKLFVAYPSTD
jgi:hypothetical protein